MSAGRAAGASRRQPRRGRAAASAITRVQWGDGSGLRGSRHGVKGIEIEEVLRWDPYLRRGGESLTLAYGSTGYGRLLLVVLRRTGPRQLRVVAARDMTEREREAYRERPR
ncbi:MAG TPA: BrnT family toxin [Planctomycetota bacterium]|nr:BrnT family toxin [Planctomycetota bacterium]